MTLAVNEQKGDDMKYHIYYFSATGNTEHSIKMIEESLKKAGHESRTVRINRASKPLDEIPDRLVIAFPVLAWRPPAFVSKFMKRLPKTGGDQVAIRAAVLAVGGGNAMGAPDAAAGILERRGYDVHIKATSIYADNWLQVSSAPVGEERKKKNEAGQSAVSDFCKALTEDREWTNYQRKPVYTFMNMIGFLFQIYGRRFMGKMFIADTKCNSCRLCKNSCPVNAIMMAKGKKAIPFWKFSCESCNRCINICPQKAINSSVPRVAVLFGLVAAMLALTISLYSRFVRPLYSDLPDVLSVLISIIGCTVFIAVSHVLMLLIIDPLVLRPLQAIKPVRKFMQLNYSKNFNRYTFDGYKAPKEQL